MRCGTVACALALALGSACGDDAAPRPDAGADAGRFDAGARDAGAADAGVLDAGPDAAESDAGTDAGPDAATTDGGAENDCVAGGGACEPVIPGACATGIIGDAEWYSCGGGIGVLCCLPPDTPPVCRRIGEAGEGWVRPDGSQVCTVGCAGSVAACEAIGTRSEGWYADDPAAGCPAIPVDRLIEWIDCTP